ncbi:hypothetical protein ABT126_29590 [Streptomyces sp. NPDC002012]|uniref:hypothetical protein n=1 Tax=Streptomyces sp. NPDC002012 TaxID=3154532 RepID=UPI00331E7CD4
MYGLTEPTLTDADIAELRELRGPQTSPVPNAFLVRLATHFLKAEIDGVINPGRHLAEALDLTRTSVLTYMRMARRRGLIERS